MRRLKICSVVLLPALISDNLLHLRLRSVQYDLLYDFSWVADEADRSVVLALLQVAFLGRCDDQELGPWGWQYSCLPDLVAGCRESSDYFLSTCLDQFCWDVVTSLSSLIALQPPLLCERWGGHYLSVWGQFSTDGSPLAL